MTAEPLNLRVVHGAPSEEEIAALAVALLAVARTAPARPEPRRTRWAADRAFVPPGSWAAGGP